MLQQPDGKILVGGSFDFVNNQVVRSLRRLNADGTPDAAFSVQAGTGLDPAGAVAALALQSTGKILVGCYSNQGYNGTSIGNLVRLNPDGSIDASFNAGRTGFSCFLAHYTGIDNNNNIRSLAVQPDDKVLVGGSLFNYNGQAVRTLVRLNADGTLDTSFDTGSLGLVFAPAVPNSGIPETILVQPDGKIVVGGNFLQLNSSTANYLVRLNADGSLDNTFVSTGTNATVRTLASQPDGKLLVGGLFTQVNGQPSGSLVRLNPDGTRDASFATGALDAAKGIYKVRLRADGTLIATGNFSTYNGTARGGVAKLSTTGLLDTSFGPATGTDDLVYELLELTTGQTLAGGIFTTFGGVARTGLARLNTPATQVDATYNPVSEFRGIISELTPLANGQLLIAGTFDTFNGLPVTYNFFGGGYHVLNNDGTYNRFLPLGTPNSYIRFPQPDGRIYLCTRTLSGATVTATLTRCLATGAPDASFAAVTLISYSGAGNPLTKITVLPGGDLLLSGDFERINGQARTYLARVSATGTLGAAFNPTAPWLGALSFYFHVIGVQPNGQAVVSWQDNLRSYLVRLTEATGALDNTFSIGTGGGPTSIFGAVLQPNGQAIVSGDFSSFGGQAAPNGVVRLTLTGQPDPTYSAALSLGASIVQPDNRLLGREEIVGQPGVLSTLFRLRRLNPDGSIDASFPAVQVPINSYVNNNIQLVLQPQDSKIILYGGFTSVNGQPRIGLASLSNVLLATRPAFAAPVLDVFPNPARQQVTLRLPATAVSATAQPVILLDMQGRTVRQFKLPARQTEASFSLADVAAGIYVLQANTAQGLSRQRVSVTH